MNLKPVTFGWSQFLYICQNAVSHPPISSDMPLLNNNRFPNRIYVFIYALDGIKSRIDSMSINSSVSPDTWWFTVLVSCRTMCTHLWVMSFFIMAIIAGKKGGHKGRVRTYTSPEEIDAQMKAEKERKKVSAVCVQGLFSNVPCGTQLMQLFTLHWSSSKLLDPALPTM